MNELWSTKHFETIYYLLLHNLKVVAYLNLCVYKIENFTFGPCTHVILFTHAACMCFEWNGKLSYLLFYVHHAFGFMFASPHFYRSQYIRIEVHTEWMQKEQVKVSWSWIKAFIVLHEKVACIFLFVCFGYDEDQNTRKNWYAEKSTIESFAWVRHTNIHITEKTWRDITNTCPY